MDILLQRIIYLCEKYHITIYALEKATELSSNSINKWNKSVPSADKLLKVARYFSVSVDFLLGNTNNPKSHLNLNTFEQIQEDIIKVIENWLLNVSCTEKSLKSNIMDILAVRGIKGNLQIDIDADDIMNDPKLPLPI